MRPVTLLSCDTSGELSLLLNLLLGTLAEVGGGMLASEGVAGVLGPPPTGGVGSGVPAAGGIPAADGVPAEDGVQAEEDGIQA